MHLYLLSIHAGLSLNHPSQPTAPVVLPQLPIVYLLGRLTRTYNHHDVPSNYAASIAHVFESHPTMMPVLWEEVKGNADSAEKQYMCIFYIDSIASVGVGLAYYISQEMKTIMELKEGTFSFFFSLNLKLYRLFLFRLRHSCASTDCTAIRIRNH
jgi:hypothetical protein